MAKDPSKTEAPTTKHREKARNEGNVPKGQELGKAMVLVGGFIALHIFFSNVATEMKSVFTWFLDQAPLMTVSPESVYSLMVGVAKRLAVMLLPIMLTIMVFAFFSQRLQVGSLWTTKVFEPKFAKMFNVVQGIQRLLLDTKTLVRLGRNVAQAVAIGFAPYLVLKNEIGGMAPLFYSTPEGIAAYILSTANTMVLYALVPMLIIGIADTWYVRWDYEENLKMTKDEVKDERKQMEGDAQVKSKQREKMLQSMSQRMLQQVPEADVVITNPTHVAVAIKYDVMEAPAPYVVAKGLDHLAQKIKEVAREEGVPIRENKPLARALYKSVEVGDTIPEEMYQAVAAILAELFKNKPR